MLVFFTYGIISPTTTTATVEIIIAAYAGTIAFKNIGKASIQIALAISKVDINIW